ncbi:MAG: hypothetical protein ACI33M_14300 [Lysinibacillus sp.]
MKKLFIILAVVGVINIGSVLYYETKLLDEPIIIANEVNLDMNSIHLSYITNLMQPSEFQSIEIDGMQYYPQNDFFMFYDSQQPIQTESYVNYTYYSIFSPTIWLEMDDMTNHLTTATEGTVYFKDGHTETIALNVRQRRELTQLDQIMSSGGTDGSSARYRVVEPFTLNSVTVVDDKVELVSFQINYEEVPLPLELPIQLNPSDTIDVATTNGVALFDGEWSTIELSGIDKQGNELVIPLIRSLNDRPSAEWVDEIVKERGNK